MRKTRKDDTLAQHVFGFLFILSLGLIVILAVDYYQVSVRDMTQVAAALLLFR